MVRTKALVTTLTSLRVLPPTYSNDFDGGDVLPEAILVKNILVEMVTSLTLLQKVVAYLRHSYHPDTQCLPEKIQAKLMSIQSVLEKLNQWPHCPQFNSANVDGENYDADSEFPSSAPKPDQIRSLRKSSIARRKDIQRTNSTVNASTLGKKRTLKSSQSRLNLLQKQRNNEKTDKDERQTLQNKLIYDARDLLLLIQNDRKLGQLLQEVLDESGSKNDIRTSNEKSDFFNLLQEFQTFAVDRIMMPYSTYADEVESLCSSIQLKHKCEKTASKLTASLEDIEAETSAKLEIKLKERQRLQKQVDAIRDKSLATIKDYKQKVQNKMKVVAWNSHARQTAILEKITELKKDLDMAMSEHTVTETALRHTNLALEAEVKELIDRYDKEMFQRHHLLDQIRADYAEEQRDMAKMLESFKIVEAQREQILEENRREEERRREQELQRIRQIVAAKVIQKAWRAFHTRKLLKSKKKRRKKTRS